MGGERHKGIGFNRPKKKKVPEPESVPEAAAEQDDVEMRPESPRPDAELPVESVPPAVCLCLRYCCQPTPCLLSRKGTPFGC